MWVHGDLSTDRVVVLEERVHSLDLLRGQALQDVQFVIALVELGAALSRRVNAHGLGPRQRLPVVHVVDVEALPQVAEDQRAVLLHLEVRRHVFPTSARQEAESINRVRRYRISGNNYGHTHTHAQS